MQNTHIELVLCVCVQTAAGSVSSSRGTSSDTDSPLNLCRGKTSPFLPLSPTSTLHCFWSAATADILSSLSVHPASFILFILSSVDHSSPPLSLPLFFSLYLSLALTSLRHCSVGEDASTHFLSLFLPARWITHTQRLHPLMVEHLRLTTRHTCSLQNIWAPHEWKKKTSFVFIDSVFMIYCSKL